MSRDLRIFCFAIALPALLIAWGGFRLITSEAEHMDETNRAGLESAAARAVADIRLYLRGEIDPLVDAVATQADTNELYAAAARLEQESPWVHRAYLAGTKGRGLRRWGHFMGRGHYPTLRAATVIKDRPLVVELEPFYVLSQLPEVLRQCGADDPENTSRFATIAEIRHRGDMLLLPATSEPEDRKVFGEAYLAPVFPNWKVRIYRRRGNIEIEAARMRYILLSCVLLLLLISPLFAGGMVLLRAARKAKREVLAKTDFISNMSHEFKTPLTTISLCAELAQENELDEHERTRAAAAIKRETNRLQRLLQGMLDFGRLEQGQRTYSPEQFDLAALARETVAFMRARSESAPVVAEGECNVFADRDAVNQVLLNIHENAVKYAKGPLEISFGPGRRENWRAIHFADRGPGLTAPQRRHVFDRFWRGDDSTTREQGGSGLGLSIARGLARGMNGDLTVAPREGGGCVFTLELPAKSPEEGEDHG